MKQLTQTKSSQFISLGQSELDIKSDDSSSVDEEQGQNEEIKQVDESLRFTQIAQDTEEESYEMQVNEDKMLEITEDIIL